MSAAAIIGAIGGGISAIGGAVQAGQGMGIGNKRKQKRQFEWQTKLNEQAGALNYQYGEMAAENQYERQLGMYDSRLSPEAQMQSQMEGIKGLGLSPALMYGGAGPGGSGSASTAPGGGGAGGQQAGKADSPAQQQMAQAQSMAVATQIAKMQSEIEVNKSVAAKNVADAEQSIQETETEISKRNVFIENLKQEGMMKWLQNVKTEYEMGGDDGSQMIATKNKEYGTAYIIPEGPYGRQLAGDIAKAWGEANNNEALAKLNDNRAKGYFQELLNATAQADARTIEAAAKKLEAEWGTTTGMNWKSWADVATNILRAIMK